MATAALELMGFFLGILGMIGNLVAILLPSWEISAHIGSNIVTAVESMKGLWMECVHQSTGAFQCETYNTILGLRADLQAARAMMVISVIFSVMACLVSSVGMQCTVCMGGSAVKTKVAGAGGGLFLTAGLMSLIPVSWKTHEVVQNFYHFNVPDSLKFEMGSCLYVGLASSLLCLLGGSLLCTSCCDNSDGTRRFRRPTGGYPYPDRSGVGSVPRGGAGSAPYRPITVNLNPTGKNPTLASQSSISSHSTAAARASRKPARHNPAASYDVTGYV